MPSERLGRRAGQRGGEREGLSGKVICTAAPRQSYLAVCLCPLPVACRPLHLWHVNPSCCIAITSQPFLLILIGSKILQLESYWTLFWKLSIEKMVIEFFFTLMNRSMKVCGYRLLGFCVSDGFSDFSPTDRLTSVVNWISARAGVASS